MINFKTIIDPEKFIVFIESAKLLTKSVICIAIKKRIDTIFIYFE